MEAKASKYTKTELILIKERLTILYNEILNMESDLDYKMIYPKILKERDVIYEFTYIHTSEYYWNMDIQVCKDFGLGQVFIAIYKLKEEILNMD